jgi:hypothetical protein
MPCMREIERVIQKGRKRVILPIHTELLFGLQAEWESRKPNPSDRVLLNPLTRKPLTVPGCIIECSLSERAPVCLMLTHTGSGTRLP